MVPCFERFNSNPSWNVPLNIPRCWPCRANAGSTEIIVCSVPSAQSRMIHPPEPNAGVLPAGKLFGALFDQRVCNPCRHPLQFPDTNRCTSLLLPYRGELFGALLKQEISFFDKEEVGALTSRLGADCSSVTRALATNINVAARNSLQAIGEWFDFAGQGVDCCPDV